MKKVVSLFLFVSFLFSFNVSKATHVMGMDVQWKSLGNDTYQIKLVVYRRCTDGAAGLSVPIPVITSDSCANAYTAFNGSYTS